MSKFKNDFQSLCQFNRNTSWKRIQDDYEHGWERYLHCICHVCELKREENGEKKCMDKSCEGCQNRVADRRVRSYHDDLMK